MQNAHLRVGQLEYMKALSASNATGTHVSVRIDRAILEPTPEQQVHCGHLVSAFGGEQEIAAVSAAIVEDRAFTLHRPGCSPRMARMGDHAVVFRGSITLPGRKQPVKHIVAISQELAQTQGGHMPDAARTVLYDQAPQFVTYRLGLRFGIPVLPEWSEWIHAELHRRGLFVDLVGFGCSPVLVLANKQAILKILSHGLKHGRISFPAGTQATAWTVPKTVSVDIGAPGT